MATLRLVATLALVTACYQHDPDLYTTTPEPVVVAGPPSGEMDAEWQPGYVDDNAAGSVTGAFETSTDPEDPGYVMGATTDAEIDTALEGYGEWIEVEGYGLVWRPYTTVVGVDFTPYETCGSWVWTDWGWTFACEWDWGWLPFHYGRWGWFDDYWGWVPDHEWTPAAVEWRGGGGYVGWRPLTPIVRDHRRKHDGIVLHDHRHEGPRVRDHRTAKSKDWQWRFTALENLGKPRIRAHLFKSPAEGLRVTSRVPRPPVRANVQPVRAASIMRGRLALASRLGAGGPHVAPSRGVRRPIRGAAFDTRPSRGARGIAPGRVTDWNRPRPASTVYQPVYQPPAQPTGRGPAHAPSAGNMPEQTYGGLPVTPTTPDPTPPPSGALSPVQQPTTVYQPPGAQQPPTLPTHRPPMDTPPRPPTSYQPPSHYTPPSQYQPPRPPTTYQPPSQYTPPSRPTTYQPPSHYSPPPSQHSPPSSYSPPARSYSPPARSSPPPARSHR